MAASKQRQVTLEEVKYLALSCLAEWLFVKIVHGEDHMLFVCSLRSLLSSQPMYSVPSHTHTASSDIKKVLVLDQLQAPPCHWLRTIWNSRAAFATTIDWRSDGVSNRSSTRKLDRRLSGTRTRVRVAESCAKRPTASRWWTRRSLKWSWCMRKLGKFQFAGDNGVVDTIQDKADEKTPLPDSKIRPAWSSDSTQCQGSCRCFHALYSKAGATFTWFWWAGRRSVCQPRYACPKSTGLFPSTDNYHYWL